MRRAGRRGRGRRAASGPLAESIATAMVRARSAALIPVEIPSFASIETVKAVSLRLRLVRAIGSRPSWSARSLVSARQISPRPCRAMKLIASGVAICAGMTRSPSFSRPSSSTRMNMRPLRASLMIASVPTRTSVVPRWISFSRRVSVSAVGFQSAVPSLRRLLGWRPAARARPARLTSPVAMMASSRSIRVVLMAHGNISHCNVMKSRNSRVPTVLSRQASGRYIARERPLRH